MHQQYIQLQQDYLMTKTKLVYSQLDFDRQKELNQSKASSDKVFQQAAAELNTLKITLTALTENCTWLVLMLQILQHLTLPEVLISTLPSMALSLK